MSVYSRDGSDGEYSVIGDKGEIGFIDYEEDRSVLCYDPTEEGPVKISVPFPFIHGKPQSILVGEKSKFSITLENTTGDPVELWKVKIFCSNPPDSFTLSLREPPSENSGNTKGFMEGYALDDRVLQAHQTLTIWLSCKPKELGLHTTVVHFDVGDDRIERVVFLLAEDKVSQSLASNKPYRRAPRKRNQFAVDDYVVSTRPASKGNQRYFKNRLPKYPIPNDIRELVENKHVPDVLTEDLVRKNYVAYFSTLLIMEELHLEEEMKAYNMECVTMKRKGAQFVVLEVPGLAERRPSLVHGDFVYAKLASDDPTNGSVYQGYIYRVEADEVLLRFAIQFHTNHSNDKLYNVQFSFNRVNMRRLYQAVEAAEHLEDDILFPSQSMNQRLMNTSPFVPVTCTLNEEQMHSVEMILGCKGGPPYVIYGPPGTGKTMTLVETILQIYKTRRNGRILICAASNSAADHILERLICNEAAEVKESEIFRLNAASRSYDDVPPDFIRFCYFEESIFKCPPLNALRRYRIVISTYMSSFLLHAEGLRSGHFSHIFLDEAGQASEPETMVPLSILCQPETVVVLAGDPKQLGPVVYSRSAENFGLGKSYLQRLFESEFYESEDDAFVTKLVRNYRCHPAILDLPSRLFYGGDLIACKEDNSSSIISKVDFFPNKEFPVLFVGIQGCDEREGNNPSWFNRIEASKVVDIINKLTSNADLSEADIGVITPYRQQVLKIKNVLETWGLPDVKVGSVEQFQGQEREVIIVSTVRSTVKHNEFDRTYCLGFLSNPKRFNVAITRAKSLLIIVGNPHIVSKDPYWEKLLWHCSDNGSYQGCPLPERQYYEAEEPLSGVDQNNEPDWDSNTSKAADWGHSDWGHSTEAEGIPWTPNPGTDATGWED